MGFLLRSFIVAGLAIALIQFSPSLLDFEPVYHDLPLPDLVGPYAPNDLLIKSKRVYEGVLHGPEALEVGPDGHIYTGMTDGYIVRLVGEKVERVARTGIKDCATEKGLPHECGRPLGLRFGKDGLLYVADAFYGILSVDVTSGKVTPLVSLPMEVEGKNITFPDDLDIDKDGVIYFSDGSTRWNLYQVIYAIMERQSDGRVLKYDPKTRKVTVVVDKIAFANGVQLADDEKSLLIAECSLRRIVKYHMQGTKKGMTEIFVEHLPGHPDNIRPSISGGYWVGLAAAQGKNNKQIFDKLFDYPVLLRLFLRTQHLIGSVAKIIGDAISCQCLTEWAFKAQNAMTFEMKNSKCMAIEISKGGKVLRSLSGSFEQCGTISHILEHKNTLYLGSYMNNYLITSKNK